MSTATGQQPNFILITTDQQRYDAASRVPFIMRPPSSMRDNKPAWRGTVHPSMVCLADIMPTFLSAAGVDARAEVDGLDLCGVRTGQLSTRNRFFHSCSGYLHAVREGDWKLCRETLGGAELLFNLADDPAEQHNLADNPSAASTRRALSKVLDDHLNTNNIGNTAAIDPSVPSSIENLPTNTCPGFRSGRREI